MKTVTAFIFGFCIVFSTTDNVVFAQGRGNGRARPRTVNRNSISGETAELQRRFPPRTPLILSIRTLSH
jgi:hypothetical protein